MSEKPKFLRKVWSLTAIFRGVGWRLNKKFSGRWDGDLNKKFFGGWGGLRFKQIFWGWGGGLNEKYYGGLIVFGTKQCTS